MKNGNNSDNNNNLKNFEKNNNNFNNNNNMMNMQNQKMNMNNNYIKCFYPVYYINACRIMNNNILLNQMRLCQAMMA